MLKYTNTLTLTLYISLIFKANYTQWRLKSSKCNVLRKTPDDVDADDDDDDDNDDKDADNENDDVDDDDEDEEDNIHTQTYTNTVRINKLYTQSWRHNKYTRQKLETLFC